MANLKQIKPEDFEAFGFPGVTLECEEGRIVALKLRARDGREITAKQQDYYGIKLFREAPKVTKKWRVTATLFRTQPIALNFDTYEEARHAWDRLYDLEEATDVVSPTEVEVEVDEQGELAAK